MLTAGPRSHAARHKKAALTAIISPLTTSALLYNYFSMSTPAVNISKSTLFLYNYPNDLTFPPLYIVPSIARSSIYPFKKIPCNTFFTLYAGVIRKYDFFNNLATKSSFCKADSFKCPTNCEFDYFFRFIIKSISKSIISATIAFCYL